MRSISALDLADCRDIAAAGETMAHQHQARVSLAICDAGGHPLLLIRLDGASPSSASVAIDGCFLISCWFAIESCHARLGHGDRPALLQLAGVFKESAVAMGGGLPLFDQGHCIGAVGVSGMTPDLDAAIAAAAVSALGEPA